MTRHASWLLALTLLSGNSPADAPAGDGEYWQSLAWQYRPLVMVAGADSRASDWESRLSANRCALTERRIHWLVIRPDGSVWRRFAGEESADFEDTRLDESAGAQLRRRAGWEPDAASRLLLFGLDGQRKYAGQPESLDTIWALIDRMPMRRAELEHEPDRCQSR